MGFNGKHPSQVGLELDAVLPRIAAKARLPALAVDLDLAGARLSRAYVDGRPAAAAGPVFSAGCLLDVILAVACNQLVIEGELDLDAPIGRYLPEIDGAVRGEPIKVRHLLTRTSGLQDPRSIEEMKLVQSWDELAPRIAAAPRLCSPGLAFNYAGIDRVLLLVLLERTTGQPLRRLIRERVLDPCGITLQAGQLGEPEADGSRRIRKFSTANFIKVIAELARTGGGPEPEAFSPALRRALQTESVPLSRTLRVQPWPRAASAVTLGLFRYSDGLTGFNGWEENQSCGARFDPQDRVAFVVALEGPPTIRDQVIAEIAERLGYRSVHSPPAPCTIGGLAGLRPAEAAGDYVGWAAGYSATVRAAAGALHCELSYRGRRFQQAKVRVEEDRWLVVDNLAQASAIEFYRDPADGQVCMGFGFLPYAKLAGGADGAHEDRGFAASDART